MRHSPWLGHASRAQSACCPAWVCSASRDVEVPTVLADSIWISCCEDGSYPSWTLADQWSQSEKLGDCKTQSTLRVVQGYPKLIQKIVSDDAVHFRPSGHTDRLEESADYDYMVPHSGIAHRKRFQPSPAHRNLSTNSSFVIESHTEVLQQSESDRAIHGGLKSCADSLEIVGDDDLR